MKRKPRLLDLFCGQGGAGMGYARAGFDVVGVDIIPQPRYPFAWWQQDALEALRNVGQDFDMIHASPPCQAYSIARHIPGARTDHPDLVAVTRNLLCAVGRPYVMENVVGAPLMPYAIMLCGLMFNLKVFRHRLFETSCFVWAPSHPSHRNIRIGEGGMCCVAGHGDSGGRRRPDGSRGTVAADHRTVGAWRNAMGIDWMTRDGLAQAVPPAYTQFIGAQLFALITEGKA